ncbi:PQQ-like beta-propeller repeat protein [Flavobacterium sp. xlx-214]|uniref:PQQ-binding-like beta-propeller repeat protein n=1 Tax=unclassified Flavobacterium TaxID=196869 RepID=UPI0013D46D32|nr:MULTISPECIES: PQQ-binding-like beta-propeller repeat protein [unclassified Flavobacterium]MBA5793505.1 PQQ-like beta-propeller repeat protein [Flavobacterium sp. xlx-221]QMI82725.1 PQQ-like beta-propeller repeat protein [Flavobacterium sp. xlx-214]
MTLLKICLLSLFFVFSSCLGQSNEASSNWRTVANNNQRSGYVNAKVMKNKPEIKVKKQALYYPVVAKGIAYYFEGAGTIYAFDIAKEKDLWSLDIDFHVNKLAIDGDILYLAGSKNLTAVNVTTQKKIWQIETPPNLVSGITIDKGIIYVGGNTLSAYDTKYGNLLWNFKATLLSGKGENFLGLPAIYNNKVYIGGNKSYFYALDAKTGTEVWKVAKGITGNPSIGAGKVFISDVDGSLHALDLENGKDIWTFKIESVGYSPVVAKEYVYVASLESGDVLNIYGVDIETGKEKWKSQFKGAASNLIVANDVLIFGNTKVSDSMTFSGTLYALEAKNGKEIWKMETNSSFTQGIVAVEDVILYTGTELPPVESGDFGNSTDHLYFVK